MSGSTPAATASPSVSTYALGVFYIVLVAAIWAAASVLVQFIYEEAHFDAPIFLTYTCTSLFAVYLPLWHALRRLELTKPTSASRFPSLTAERAYRDGLRQREGLRVAAEAEDSSEAEGLIRAEVLHVAPPSAGDVEALRHVVSQRSHMALALVICPLWFFANASYNVSLDLTSVTNSTILSTTSSIFTYVFGLVTGEEQLRGLSVLGVACTFGGVVLTTLSDAESSDGGGQSLRGDLVCLFGATMYGAYTVALKRFSPADGDVSTSLMLGYMGSFNGLFLLPVVCVVAAFHVEPIGALTWQVFGLLVLKGLLDNVLSDYLWMRAVLLTSPTVATVGLSLTVPMAFATDFLFKGGVLPSWGSVWGSLLVVAGFAAVTAAQSSEGGGGCTRGACRSDRFSCVRTTVAKLTGK